MTTLSSSSSLSSSSKAAALEARIRPGVSGLLMMGTGIAWLLMEEERLLEECTPNRHSEGPAVTTHKLPAAPD
ncbi:hypothetical protein NHX12_033136, partial [Muraenolepis orangiensis]